MGRGLYGLLTDSVATEAKAYQVSSLVLHCVKMTLSSSTQWILKGNAVQIAKGKQHCSNLKSCLFILSYYTDWSHSSHFNQKSSLIGITRRRYCFPKNQHNHQFLSKIKSAQSQELANPDKARGRQAGSLPGPETRMRGGSGWKLLLYHHACQSELAKNKC